MPSPWIRRLVALVRIDVSEERIAFIIRVKRIDELGTLAVTKVVASSLTLFTLKMETIRSSKNVGSYKSYVASHPRRRPLH
jgi:hypothetical protein